MSVYYNAGYMAEAIDSILKQSFADFEFLIFDDGSTDGSASLLDNYAARDERIRIIHLPEHQALAETLNQGIALAKGEYIARMDADDISLQERFKKQVDFLDKHTEVAVVSVFTKVIDKDGKEIGEHRPATNHEQIKKMSFFSGQLCHPAVMFRKEAIMSLGGYNEQYLYAQDYELWFRVMKRYQVANLPEILFYWRKIGSGTGVAKRKEQLKFAQQAKINAVKNGLYPKYYMAFLGWPHARKLVPKQLKEMIKKYIK